MLCYPGQMIGLYEPPQIEIEQCRQGIPCNFGICSECTVGGTKEELNETKANIGNVIDWNDFGNK